jgi:mono/diheme cytochrome c family protein
MKRWFLSGLLILCCVATANAAEGDYVKFQQIIDDKCSRCHTRFRIEDAIQQGADMDTIIAKMIRFGARLDDQEGRVMGVFWAQGSEFKASLPEGAGAVTDPLQEYRAVAQNRCTGCHSLDILEKTIAEGRSINDLIDMMRKRGAIITDADKSVLGTFWGNPLKEPEEK